MLYSENNVFDEALNRIRMLYDTHDDVIVSMSGGKDSTVLFHLALMVAKERGRLPLKVFWLDQEAEWQHTVDYMESIMRMPEVEPYWYQIPFDFTNSLSADKNFIRLWDENAKDLWIHPQSDISIKENPTKYKRFHDLADHLHDYMTDSDNYAVLVGLRYIESRARRFVTMSGKGTFQGETWAKKKGKRGQTFYPIYDFTDDDIWTAIGRNHWPYNPVYDYFYRFGIPKNKFRVSALIHETAWHSLEMLQEIEPKTYQRLERRVPGISAFGHAFDEGGVIPRELPFAFKDWKEYRDYLLEHITKPEYRDLFRKRWKGQDTEQWYKLHVGEVIVNDIDGTKNGNLDISERSERGKARIEKAKNRDLELFRKYMAEKESSNDKRPTNS